MNKKIYPNDLLRFSKLTDELFNELISSELSVAQFIYLSSNQSLSHKHIDYLFSQNIENVNINLLRNKNCPKREIENFLLLKDKIYNIAIAHNTNLSQVHLNKLLSFADKDVTMSLEFNNMI